MTLSSQLRAVAVVAVLGVLLLGCGSGGKDSGPGSDPYTRSATGIDATYVVTSATEGGANRVLVPGTEIRFAFTPDQVRISAGCNTMSGRYSLQGGRLEIIDLATTDMGCDQARMEQDTWVAGLFAGPVQLRTENDAAIISGDVVLALADREVVSPDKPLIGTTWVLDSIGATGADGAVSSVPQGVVASFTIRADGTVEVTDGCNGGSGPARIEEGRIVWGQRVQTLIGCSGAKADVAEAVGRVLSGATPFSVEERSLTITKGEEFLGFRAR